MRLTWVRIQNIVFPRLDAKEVRTSGFTTVSRNPFIGYISGAAFVVTTPGIWGK
jgi:hypothetical protein